MLEAVPFRHRLSTKLLGLQRDLVDQLERSTALLGERSTMPYTTLRLPIAATPRACAAS